MSNLSTLPKGDSAWLLRKAIERIIQQVSVLETNIGASTSGNSANTQIIFNDNGTLRGDAGLVYNKTTDTLTAGSAVITGDLTVDTSTLKVDSTLNKVGIGVATLTGLSTLNVAGDVAITSDLVLKNGSGTAQGYIFGSSGLNYRVIASNPHVWQEGGTDLMRLNSTGLGIGQSPTAALDVYRAEVSSAAGTTAIITNTTGGGNRIAALRLGNLSALWNIRAFGNGDTFRIGAGSIGSEVDYLTIDASGRLLVGTTDAGSNSGIGLKAAYSATAPYFSTVGSSTSASEYSYLLYSTGGTPAFKFYVSYSGQISATSGTVAALSDARFKENIQDIDVGLGAILALKPRKFDWKAGRGKDIKGDRGFIAQEFETVFPNLIDEWADPAPEGEAPYKSVRQDLIPVLVKAIQELTARVQTLETR